MDNKNIVTRIKVIPVYELEAIAEYLENMAEEGLFLVKHSGMFWKFTKSEPRKVHYYVDSFDKASMFDTRPEVDTIDYIEYCKTCGWEYVLTEGKLQYFISYEENPVDIQTDNEQRLKSINKMARLSAITTPIIMILVAVEMILSAFCFDSKPFVLMERIDILTLVVWVIAGASNVFGLVSYLTFYLKNKRRVKNGEPIAFRSLKKASVTYSIALCSVLLLLVGFSFLISRKFAIGMIAGIFVVLLIAVLSNRFYDNRYSRKENKIRYILLSVGVIIASFVMVFVIVISVASVDITGNHTETIKQGNEILTYDSYEIPYTFENAGIEIPENAIVERWADEEKLISGTINSYNTTAYEDVEFENMLANMHYSIAKFNNSKNNEEYIQYTLSDEYIEHYEEIDVVAEKWNSNKAYKITEEFDEVTLLICYDDYSIKISPNLVENIELNNILQ